MSTYYLQSLLSFLSPEQPFSHPQHCFLLDGNATFPVESGRRWRVPLQRVECTENRFSSHCQKQSRSDSFDGQQNAMNQNKHCQVDQDDLPALSSPLMTKRVENKQCTKLLSSRKIASGQRHPWKRHRINHRDTTESCRPVR
jgi:hypothetical protein